MLAGFFIWEKQMEVEVIPHQRETPVKINKGKYHNETSTDLALRREMGLVSYKSKEDICKVLKRYASELTMDLANVCETLGCSYSTLMRHIKEDEELSQFYDSIKRVKGERFVYGGLKVLEDTYEETCSGEPMNPKRVDAAKNLANYRLLMGRTLNPDYAPQTGGAGAPTAIQINFGQSIPPFMQGKKE